MNTTLKDWITESPERQRLFAQEQLIVAVAEHVWEQMEARKVSKSAIATALGKSKAFITQLLNGTRNMTLRSLSDIAFALDANVDIRFRPKVTADDWSVGVTGRIVTSVVAERHVDHNAARSDEFSEPEIVRLRVPEAA